MKIERPAGYMTRAQAERRERIARMRELLRASESPEQLQTLGEDGVFVRPYNKEKRRGQ